MKMNVLDLLHQDHEKVSDLLEMATSSNDAAKRETLFQQIRREVELHARAEEGIFYPAVERIGARAADAIATAIAQHGEAINLIGDIRKIDASSPAFQTKLRELAHLIRTHVQHEESRIFDLARTDLNGDLERLGDLVKRREDELKVSGPQAQ
jgi:hemerythrin superfamily protein